MSNFISDKWLRPANPIEAKYAEVLQDALDGNHSTNADDCNLQNAVARLVAMELKLNPRLFAINSDSAVFTRIGYQVAMLVDRELNQCARFYAEAA
jgi:hypothetical protein